MGVEDAKADRCCMFYFLNLFLETPKCEIFAYTFQSNEYADSRHLCEASGRRHGGGACAFPYGLMALWIAFPPAKASSTEASPVLPGVG